MNSYTHTGIHTELVFFFKLYALKHFMREACIIGPDRAHLSLDDPTTVVSSVDTEA